jgi:hypothetical protein
VAGTAALLAVLGYPIDLPAHEVRFSAPPVAERLVAEAEVTELATGAVSTVHVEAVRGADAPPAARVGEARFGLEDLFGMQRERIGPALADAAEDAALAGVRHLLGPLLAPAEAWVPGIVELLGRDGARRIAAGLAGGADLDALVAETRALRARGAVFPPSLAGRLAAALEARVDALPGSAPDVLRLLDLVAASGLDVDLGRAQVGAFVRVRAAGWQGTSVAEVCERLGLAREES